MQRVHVIVFGDVQGVGYRYTAKMHADQLGVTGWIRNRTDGTVEAEVEGAADAVDAMLAWMAGGPPGSRVDNAQVSEREVTGSSDFDVRGTD